MSGDRADNIKHSVTIRGHRTSITLEPAFWDALKDIAAEQGVSVNQLITTIDATNPRNLSSALRVFVLDRMKREIELKNIV